MRSYAFAILSAVGLSLPGLASAVTYPPDALLPGEVAQTVVSNQCYIVRGNSDFLRNGAANRAVISISDMVAAGYELKGHVMLAFTSTTGGTARFNYATAYPAGIQAAPFTGYSQSYDATTKNLHAQFTINFPSCSLQVSGAYASP